MAYKSDLESGINHYVEGENQTAKGEQNEIELALETLVVWDKQIREEI